MNNIIEELINTGERYSADNAILMNCTNEFLDAAYHQLVSNEECRSCRVIFNEKRNKNIEELFSHFDEMNKRIFARTYVISLILREMYNAYPEVENFGLGFNCEDLEQGLQAFANKDYKALREYYIKAPWAFDIETIVRKFGKAELNIFISTELDRHLQQEINNQIGSRLPYCVKIFTNQKRLSSYAMTNGQFIQSPHDFMEYDYTKLESKTI